MLQYFGVLLLSSVLSVAWLWHHLMVWKVFALWYMFGSVELLCIDIVMFAELWLGVDRIVSRTTHTFMLPEQSVGSSSQTAAEVRQ
jgi:hypothetical protein